MFCANTGSVLQAACGGMCSNVSWRSSLHSEQGPTGLSRRLRGMSTTVTGTFDRATGARSSGDFKPATPSRRLTGYRDARVASSSIGGWEDHDMHEVEARPV